MLNVGITGQAVCRVDKENTAAALGSGMLEVFATPAMISLIERAACESVQPYLEEGCGSVGTELRVKHLAATPVGMTVTAKTELIQVEGRRLVGMVSLGDLSRREDYSMEAAEALSEITSNVKQW